MYQVPIIGVNGNQVKNLNGPATVSDEPGLFIVTGIIPGKAGLMAFESGVRKPAWNICFEDNGKVLKLISLGTFFMSQKMYAVQHTSNMSIEYV